MSALCAASLALAILDKAQDVFSNYAVYRLELALAEAQPYLCRKERVIWSQCCGAVFCLVPSQLSPKEQWAVGRSLTTHRHKSKSHTPAMTKT